MTEPADRRSGRLLSLPPAPDAIELRHLRAFVAVAEELNFSRAAARLYVSQPALSRQISSLERLVGCNLLRRNTHQVDLTLAGEALLGHTRPLLSDLDDAVVATRSVGGEIEGRIARLWADVVADGDAGTADLRELRTSYEKLNAQFPTPAGTTVRPANADGVPALVATPGPDVPATVLYLHGGGYVMGSAFGYQPLVGALAAATGTGVVVPDYRLAPEHRYPAAIDDAERVYRWMLDHGTDPDLITVGGDSSGGGLTMTLLMRLKREGLPMPGRAVLLCPWLDLTCTLQRYPTGSTGPSEARTDPADTRRAARHWATTYLAGHPADAPEVSPLTADLTGLPPLLIQVGTGDYVLDESRLLAEHAKEHGVDARVELYPVATHVFHLFWSFLPEAADALEHVGQFLAETGAPDAEASAAGTA